MGKHSRNTDPVTSHLSAPDNPARETHRLRLLEGYHRAGRALTDNEAAAFANFNPMLGLWKRCSDLRKAGLIEYETEDGKPIKVKGWRGKPVHVCVITRAGLELLRKEGVIP